VLRIRIILRLVCIVVSDLYSYVSSSDPIGRKSNVAHDQGHVNVTNNASRAFDSHLGSLEDIPSRRPS